MLQNRRAYTALAGTLFAAFAMLAPNTASAQLGRLKKAVGDAAKDAAGVKPANNDAGTENFPITVDRLDAVIPTFEASIQASQREFALKTATAEYTKAHQAQQTCFENATKAMMAGGGVPMPNAQKAEQAAASSAATNSMMQRMLAAQQKQNFKQFVYLQDSVAVTSFMSSAIMMGLETKCGKPPYKPAAVVEAEAQHMATGGSAQSSGQFVAPAARAGMTNYQFGMLRERAALWALQQTGNAPVGNNKYSVFTKDEQAALEARGDRLKKLVPYFKEQPTRWTSWNDLAGW